MGIKGGSNVLCILRTRESVKHACVNLKQIVCETYLADHALCGQLLLLTVAKVGRQGIKWLTDILRAVESVSILGWTDMTWHGMTWHEKQLLESDVSFWGTCPASNNNEKAPI